VLTAAGGTATSLYSSGIIDCNITLNGGTLSAEGGTAGGDSKGIFSFSGTYTLAISDGTLTAQGDTKAIDVSITLPASYDWWESTTLPYTPPATGTTFPGTAFSNSSGVLYVKIETTAPPAINGPTALTLTEGYAATSTGPYTLAGNPAPAVTKTSGDVAITWNSATLRLDIAAGLTAGTYPVALTAANGVLPDATLTFTLTVAPATTPPTGVAPRIDGPASLRLTVGYTATSVGPYTVAGSPVPKVTKPTGDDRIVWNNVTRRLDIAPGLPAGIYEVKLRAENSVSSHTFVFTLTVANPVYFLDLPGSFVGGTVTVKTGNRNPYLAEAGDIVTVTVVPDEGYELGEIHVYKLADDGRVIESVVIPLSGSGNVFTFVMPAHHVSIAVTFLDTRSTGIDAIGGEHTGSPLRAHIQNGMLYVSGLTPGQPWSVYNPAGTLIYQGTAPSTGRAETPLPTRGVYIVRSADKVVKAVH
jgi:hypothetical protein